MKIIKNPKQLSETINRLHQQGKRVGFVPTMGYLHEGHLSLVRRARRENDLVIVSVFVNPIQFGSKEDLKRYPRNLNRDKRLLSLEQVDYLFLPKKETIYPKAFQDYIHPGEIARRLCGAKRPGHFRGVATVVNRLFEIVHPDRAYFGQKDYQQIKVIQEMVRQRNWNVQIKTCPIVREKDGLAMSSRNAYLSKQERIRARAIYQSLFQAKKLIQLGETDASLVKKETQRYLKPYVSQVDYVDLVDPEKLQPVKRIRFPLLMAVACYVGRTRLIDNLLIKR